ncbi:hypothetical protein [Actinomadura rubrisoli]|uniref:Uncharacterized protein n=1 Tax=Actinomadura rubrisoli TaxID=2530368 RepID=A0A4R5AW91_9ACTN|nr:hypothetical protein [Actinomadura rubrisoli]TDD77718.1 hypothetical protein E1298_29765 [Actinomadura rubrisoli]
MTNPPVDQETGEIQVRPFADVLRDLGRGCVIDEAAVMLQDLVRAVRDYGKKGTFNLRVEIAPMKGENEALIVSASATAKPPAGEATTGVFFADGVGNLVRDDPRQPQLPLRELNSEKKDLKQA